MLPPITQPMPEREEIDARPITLVDLINPSIILLDVPGNLKVLLSRNTIMEPETIQLRRARLIEIPRGWRLKLIQFASRFHRVCLPDEFEFDVLHLDIVKALKPADKPPIGYVKNLSQIVQLTSAEYMQLRAMNGRRLHSWVTNRFDLAHPESTGNPLYKRRAA